MLASPGIYSSGASLPMSGAPGRAILLPQVDGHARYSTVINIERVSRGQYGSGGQLPVSRLWSVKGDSFAIEFTKDEVYLCLLQAVVV